MLQQSAPRPRSPVLPGASAATAGVRLPSGCWRKPSGGGKCLWTPAAESSRVHRGRGPGWVSASRRHPAASSLRPLPTEPSHPGALGSAPALCPSHPCALCSSRGWPCCSSWLTDTAQWLGCARAVMSSKGCRSPGLKLAEACSTNCWNRGLGQARGRASFLSEAPGTAGFLQPKSQQEAPELPADIWHKAARSMGPAAGWASAPE